MPSKYRSSRKSRAFPPHHISTWCSDLDDENLEYVREKYVGENFTKNYMDILEDDEVQGVLSLTCHDVREKIIRDAAEHGKHIFVEKPMSTTARGSYDIMRIIQENNVKLTVGFNRRYIPWLFNAYRISRGEDVKMFALSPT